jgi:hypothetical protein
MSGNQTIKDKIRDAEEAVSEMKDPELKRVAFQTVLASLLGASIAGPAQHRQDELPSKKKTKAARATNAPHSHKAAADKASTIRLDVQQLKELKAFYDQCAPDGTENVVFTLARFLAEKVEVRLFHAVDLLLVYQNLLPLKPATKPPAMSMTEIVRACQWLTAPSRRKQWLSSLDNGMYEISPQGMIHANYDQKAVKTAKAA